MGCRGFKLNRINTFKALDFKSQCFFFCKKIKEGETLRLKKAISFFYCACPARRFAGVSAQRGRWPVLVRRSAMGHRPSAAATSTSQREPTPRKNASAANNPYWTSIAGGTRADGTKYSSFRLIEGQNLPVASAWYGQDVHFRVKGTTGPGAVVKVPEYSQLKEPYKKAIRVFNAYSPDTGDSFYGHFISAITDDNGFLQGLSTQN